MKKSLILFFFSLFVYNVIAQKEEGISIHFNQPFYATGEDIWYKVYFHQPASKIQTGLLYVEYLAPNGLPLKKQKLRIQGNYAIGDFAIPYDWEEGNYLFRVYTAFEEGEKMISYFEKVIPIFNLSLEESLIKNVQTTNNQQVTGKNTTKKLSVQLDIVNKEYKKRDSIELHIQTLLNGEIAANTQLSIAVLDGNYFDNFSSQKHFNTIHGPVQKQETQQAFFEKELTLNAYLTNEQAQPISTRFLTLYFPKSKTFQQSKVENGQLKIALAHLKGSQPIQFFDMNPFHHPVPNVRLIVPKINKSYQGKPLHRTPVIANYLSLLSKYRQYKEVFKIKIADYQQDLNIQKQVFAPDKSYLMSKYKSLSDLASFVKEIIPGSRINKKNGQQSIQLRYADKNVVNKLPPWYMINDWLTIDENLILKQIFHSIEKIDLFNSKKSISTQLDPSMVSRGLLMITTKEGNIDQTIRHKPNNQIFEGLYPLRQFPQVAQAAKSPDFRPTIYWNPRLQTNKNGKLQLKFANSDAIGKCFIFVQGVDLEGNGGIFEGVYEVKLQH